jgi:YD repeat-containing protein
LLILTSLPTVAQDASKFLSNIIPPSPTARELGKYGNVPVGMFTGAANISVPLITFKTKDLESPMSLFYGSNGIKVDEVASNVGLGWNLNFGGVITRTVRDKSDDTQTRVYPPDNLLSGATNAESVQFYKAAGQDNADTESDVYSFNFNGNSGKFVYDKNGEPVLVNNQKIKIEKCGSGNADFLLTTTNGVKYYFTEKEMTTFRSQGAGHSVISGATTAWYLSKMAHPNGSEIYLSYDNANMDYTASNSQTLSMSYPQIQNGCDGSTYANPPTLSGIVSFNMTVIGKRVNKICSNNSNDGYVTFDYGPSGVNEEVDGNSKINTITQFNADGRVIEKINFNYLKTANERVFLQNITCIDPSKKYAFEYINQTSFPKRLATSQDHWGYYNGKDNNINLVPKNIADFNIGINNIDYNGADKEPNADFAKTGLLKKIFYPTKGYTEFDYESNTYWGEKTTYNAKTVEKIDLSFLDENNDGIDDTPKGSSLTFTSPINQRIEFTGYVYYASAEEPKYDQYGDLIPDPRDTGHYNASMQIKDENSGDILDFYQITQFGTPYYYKSAYTIIKKVTNTVYFDAEAGKSYTVSLLKSGLRASTWVEMTYYKTKPEKVTTNLETGGVRIKSTKDFAEASARANYKRYYYAPKDDINHSSGDKGKMPLYIDIELLRRLCQSGPGSIFMSNNSNLVVSSSSIISLFDTGSSNCFYKYVTVSEGGDAFENGGEMKEFIVHRDNWEDNFGANGQVNGSSRILGTVDIKSAPFTNFGWDNGLEIRSQVFQKKNGTAPFVVVAENENKYKLDPSYSKEVKAYNVRKHFSDLFAVVEPIDYLSIVEYATKSYWFYLESSISKKYDFNGQNPITTVTNYGYNNSTHLQLTSQSTKSSLAETLETKYYYPQDLAMAAEPFVSEMITSNRIDAPLKTETFRGNIKQSEQKTEYAKDPTTSNLLLPKFIYAARFPNSLSTANSLERKITYDKYDNKGNILQYTLENGTPVAIIWGYNQTQPIAKIENATYDQAIAAYSTNETNFRSSLPNAMVTTYTYIPLVGIKTITDPKGQVTTYDYDEYNRMKLVKDTQGNILSENQYHYKN